MDPVISGTTIMLLRWVFTTSGFSLMAASFFFLRSFLIRAMGFLFIPLENFLLILQVKSSMSCSWFMSRSWSRSTPRKVNFLKVLLFFNSVHVVGDCENLALHLLHKPDAAVDWPGLVENVDRSNTESKLLDFIARVRDVYVELKHGAVLEEKGVAKFFSRTVQNGITWVAFWLALFVNVVVAMYRRQLVISKNGEKLKHNLSVPDRKSTRLNSSH